MPLTRFVIIQGDEHLTSHSGLALIGALPTWPHSRSWGYYPTGGLGMILVIVVILLVLGRI